ncbi:MAG: maleylpyruvate isomerase family mycothiol-dependent enzyme [Actinomycetota bacterium]|nr:maleylpyruvate isomerase family mycothiol-dependent enzyme [Actinomycetota bacterium]
MTELDRYLGWWRAGEDFFASTLEQVPEANLIAPSLLQGWSRQTLLAHVGLNADALANLLTWARTGVETPMYASPEARNADIEQVAALPASEVVARYGASRARFTAAVESLPDEAWESPVRTAQGREVPAAQVAWMRVREVWIHAVDLAASAQFADLPTDLGEALLDDVTGWWQRRDGDTAPTLSSVERSWGAGPAKVRGSLAELLGWATGRVIGDREPSPRWI